MRKINQDIKNQTFQNIYLLYGEEAYLKKQYKDRLKAAVCGEDTMNYAYFEGKNTDVNEIISIADTMPFFAEKRLVVIENSGFFKKADEKIVEYLRILEKGDIKMELDGRRLFVSGEEISLTAKEFDLQELMVGNPNKVFSREELLNTVWGYEYPGDVRTVDVHIRRLREKIEPNPGEPRYVHTKWGVGYYFKG